MPAFPSVVFRIPGGVLESQASRVMAQLRYSRSTISTYKEGRISKMQRVKVSLAIAIGFMAIGAGFLFRGGVASAYEAPQRPPIVGLAHVGLLVGDLSMADEFYGHVLGLAH